MKIVLATNNRDKVREIRAIMAPIDVQLVGPDAIDGMPEIVEDGDTLEDNALKKARGIRAFTGMCALADDTGLEVDALDGAPGVYSSRFARDKASYDENNAKLLGELAGVPAEKRTARFRCVMALALVDDERDALVTEGILEGRIATEKRGEAGFGYDPLFEVAELGRTLAEIGLEKKNEVSHRYRALVEMRELLIRLGLASGR